MNKFLGLFSIGFLGYSNLAFADLDCQGYYGSGHVAPITFQMHFTLQRSSPSVMAGLTTITSGSESVQFRSKYAFGNEVTRCVVGKTIETTGKELSVDLYEFNS